MTRLITRLTRRRRPNRQPSPYDHLTMRELWEVADRMVAEGRAAR